MTAACIGWKGDTDCALGNPFHGCKLAEDVTHGYHVCACGARMKASTYEPRTRKDAS